MAALYGALVGKVPEQPTERTVELIEALKTLKPLGFAELEAKYAKLEQDKADLAKKVKTVGVESEAIEILMRELLSTQNMEKVTVHGYTWSSSPIPCPVCDDPEATAKYLAEHEMGDKLVLTKAELAGRVKEHVKAEALANELVIEMKTVDGVEVPEVRSQIDGVRVFLKTSMSRRKVAVKIKE